MKQQRVSGTLKIILQKAWGYMALHFRNIWGFNGCENIVQTWPKLLPNMKMGCRISFERDSLQNTALIRGRYLNISFVIEPEGVGQVDAEFCSNLIKQFQKIKQIRDKEEPYSFRAKGVNSNVKFKGTQLRNKLICYSSYNRTHQNLLQKFREPALQSQNCTYTLIFMLSAIGSKWNFCDCPSLGLLGENCSTLKHLYNLSPLEQGECEGAGGSVDR